jgi:hypothetical protein
MMKDDDASMIMDACWRREASAAPAIERHMTFDVSEYQ